MDEDQALAALRANFGDGARYEAYASAVEARDPERAELIRSSLEDARAIDIDLDPMRVRARRRLRSLEDALRRRLPPSVRDIAEITLGFVEGIVVPDEQPLLRERDAIVSAFAEMVERGLSLAGLESLSLRRVGTPGAVTLAGLPILSTIRRLRLDPMAFSTAGLRGLRAIADSPHLGSLRDLTVRAVDGDAGAAALTEGTGIRALERLIFSKSAMGDDGAARIAAWSAAATLNRLDLYDNHIGVVGATRLAELPALHELDLGLNSKVGDEGAAAILSGPAGRSLRGLWLGFTGMGRRALAALASAPCAAELRDLDIGNSELGEAVREPHAIRLDRIVTLKLGCSELDGDGLEHVLRWIQPREGAQKRSRLRVLALSGNRIDDLGCRPLVESAWLRPDSIDLTYNPIGAVGRAALRKRFGDRVQLGEEEETPEPDTSLS